MTADLYVILDRTAARGRDLDELLDAALAGGCRMVPLREKEWLSGRLLPLARRLRERRRAAGATFIVNDRVDLACAVDADGGPISARTTCALGVSPACLRSGAPV